MAVASSPLGRSIVWISEGKLWAWRKDSKDGFITEDGFCLEERLMNFTVRDARMGADGILELERGTSIFAAYLCDADAVLRPLRKLWIPASARENGRLISWRADQGGDTYDTLSPEFLLNGTKRRRMGNLFRMRDKTRLF